MIKSCRCTRHARKSLAQAPAAAPPLGARSPTFHALYARTRVRFIRARTRVRGRRMPDDPQKLPNDPRPREDSARLTERSASACAFARLFPAGKLNYLSRIMPWNLNEFRYAAKRGK